MKKEITREILLEAAGAFDTLGEIVSCEPYGSGHINDTFRLVCKRPYILQRNEHRDFQKSAGPDGKY